MQVKAFRDASRIAPPSLTIQYTEVEVGRFALDNAYANPTVKVQVCVLELPFVKLASSFQRADVCASCPTWLILAAA